MSDFTVQWVTSAFAGCTKYAYKTFWLGNTKLKPLSAQLSNTDANKVVELGCRKFKIQN